jgi:hypothetical protein
MSDVKVVRLKKPTGEFYGAWRVVVRKKDGHWKSHGVSTGESDEAAAKEAGARIIAEAEANPEAHVVAHVPPSLRLAVSAGPAPTSDSSPSRTPPRSTLAPEAPQIDAAEVLGKWALGPEYQPQPKAPQAAPEPTLEKPNYAALAGLVGRLNVAAIGMSIRAFGRAPAKPSEGEMEELAKAWEAQLAIWLKNTEMAPWVMILGISCAMGFTMYSGGIPLPPKDQVDE